MEYDIIGDVHGHADALEELLRELGYTVKNGAYRHSNPNRMAFFLGDLVDRGPRQLDAIDIPRRMRDAGSALISMGNHELNAIGYGTPDIAKGEGHFLRIRGSKNRAQHKAFLEAVGEDSDLHKELVEWMKTIPLFIELDGFRCAHACWHPKSIQTLLPHIGADGVLNEDVLIDSFSKGSPFYDAVETVTKGLEIDLPEGVFFHDKQGTRRVKSRVKWWEEGALTYATGAITEEGMTALPDDPLPDHVLMKDDNEKPVFFGHYWMTGTPYILSQKRTCLDFSIAKDGVLAAYTWRGETELTPDHLTYVEDPASTPSLRVG